MTARAPRTVYGRLVVTDLELHALPSERQREYLVTRKYADLLDVMDETSRVPEWHRFAQARQGME